MASLIQQKRSYSIQVLRTQHTYTHSLYLLQTPGCGTLESAENVVALFDAESKAALEDWQREVARSSLKPTAKQAGCTDLPQRSPIPN